jgi:hypothetical protein
LKGGLGQKRLIVRRAFSFVVFLPLGGVPVPGGSDLIAHFLLFAAIAFAAVGFARAPAQLACLGFVTIGFGVSLEYAQGLVPYRSSEIGDGVANSLGGLAGYAAALLVFYFVIRSPEPPVGLSTRHYIPECSTQRC